jgi:hypothetical protein
MRATKSRCFDIQTKTEIGGPDPYLASAVGSQQGLLFPERTFLLLRWLLSEKTPAAATPQPQ